MKGLRCLMGRDDDDDDDDCSSSSSSSNTRVGPKTEPCVWAHNTHIVSMKKTLKNLSKTRQAAASNMTPRNQDTLQANVRRSR